MNAKKIFYNTLVLSIIVQLITGLLQFKVFCTKVPPMYYIIKQLLFLDIFVQTLEGLFYFWLAYHFASMSNITPNRYVDWCITTPTMLVTLMVYLIYLEKIKTNAHLDLFNIVKENASVFVPVLCLNWAMLLFGYLGETRRIPMLLGVGLGFIPFLMYYYIIYVNYVNEYSNLFWYFFFFWSLYGIAATFPYYVKNACYNILDLFSKNFFGVFLSYLIFYGKY
jgi:hypothetical protein